MMNEHNAKLIFEMAACCDIESRLTNDMMEMLESIARDHPSLKSEYSYLPWSE